MRLSPFATVRISAILFTALLCFAGSGLPAQNSNPGAQQDAEAAREKLLKASDQLDNIQANSEATKLSVESMKDSVTKLQADVTQLQTDNAALKQQMASAQATFEQYQAEQAKARQVLIDKVADMIAAGKASSKTVKKKKDAPAPDPDPEPIQLKTSDPDAPAAGEGAQPSQASAPGPDAGGENADAIPVKPKKGYYHVVANGETLNLICTAYRENGVNVTVTEVRKANGLTERSVLKVGQKLFIPKPGT